MSEIAEFKKRGCEIGSVGKSVLGNDIPYIFIGEHGGKSLIVVGAMHAREHITALLVTVQAKECMKRRALGGGIYFIPNSNPDGVRLSQEGVGFLRKEGKNELANELEQVNRGQDFRLWKANINCVDINVNFNADWGTGKSNVFYKRSSDYVGKRPESEPETQALTAFTRQVMPDAIITYHTKGEVIYWYYGQREKRLWRDYGLVRTVARQTGYAPAECRGSAGGYKDWCISKLNIAALTIEVGNDSLPHPVSYKHFDEILKRNLETPITVLDFMVKHGLHSETIMV